MFLLAKAAADCLIWGVPYHETVSLAPVELAEGMELEVITDDDARSDHLPDAQPAFLGFDSGDRPLRADAPQDRRRWRKDGQWFLKLTPGSFLFPDGRPALVFGAKAGPARPRIQETDVKGTDR